MNEYQSKATYMSVMLSSAGIAAGDAYLFQLLIDGRLDSLISGIAGVLFAWTGQPELAAYLLGLEFAAVIPVMSVTFFVLSCCAAVRLAGGYGIRETFTRGSSK